MHLHDPGCQTVVFSTCASSSSQKALDQSDLKPHAPVNGNPLSPRDFQDALLVDTLALMKSFENSGLSREQAEAITRHITQLILSQASHNRSCFTSKEEMERVIVTIGSKQQQHKQEMQVCHKSSIRKIVHTHCGAPCQLLLHHAVGMVHMEHIALFA